MSITFNNIFVRVHAILINKFKKFTLSEMQTIISTAVANPGGGGLPLPLEMLKV